MNDTPRRISPDERVIQPNSHRLQAYDIAPPHHVRGDARELHPLHDVTEIITKTAPAYPNFHTPSTSSHPESPILPTLIAALNDGDHNMAARISALPGSWREVNNAGNPFTKRHLEKCTWGALTESDSIQNPQQAIITSYPPLYTHVKQFTANLAATICNDSSFWHHTIRNAYQDHILPHQLHNPTTIFIIHHNDHYTILITDKSLVLLL